MQKQLIFRRAVENLEDLDIPKPEKINLNAVLNIDLEKYEKFVQKFGKIENFELSQARFGVSFVFK